MINKQVSPIKISPIITTHKQTTTPRHYISLPKRQIKTSMKRNPLLPAFTIADFVLYSYIFPEPWTILHRTLIQRRGSLGNKKNRWKNSLSFSHNELKDMFTWYWSLSLRCEASSEQWSRICDIVLIGTNFRFYPITYELFMWEFHVIPFLSHYALTTLPLSWYVLSLQYVDLKECCHQCVIATKSKVYINLLENDSRWNYLLFPSFPSFTFAAPLLWLQLLDNHL